MTKKSMAICIVAAVIAAVCLFMSGMLIGKAIGNDALTAWRESLYALNRSSVARLDVAKGEKVYVVGHKSPDSDTVCSAIAFADFLKKLGYEAEAAVNGTVNKESEYILQSAGVKAPPVLENAAGKKVLLVDHSEYLQSTDGLEEAQVVGILDHHGVGSVTTGAQLWYDARPIGASATIVWLEYLNYGFDVDKTTAYLLLGAVLSDTYGLTGSTTTDADRQAVQSLAVLAGVNDTDALYAALHAESLSYKGMSDGEIFLSDYKEYEINGANVGIALVSAIDEDAARELAGRMKAVLPSMLEKKGVDLLYVSVGMRENGEKIDRVVPADEDSAAVLTAAFPNYDEFDGTSYIFRTGIGRKTVFVPGLTEYLNAHPYK